MDTVKEFPPRITSLREQSLRDWLRTTLEGGDPEKRRAILIGRIRLARLHAESIEKAKIGRGDG